MNVLFVLNHADPAVVKQFLSSNAMNFFKLLTHCVRIFQYNGLAAPERIMSHAVKKSALV